MQIGHLRIHRNHVKKKWVIQGIKKGKWTNCYDIEREKLGYDKWLMFDLKYDACGALLMYAEWVNMLDKIENTKQHTKRKSPLSTMISKQNRLENKIKKTKVKRKIAKKSRRRNR